VRRTTAHNSGAELRRWLLETEQELFDAMMAPPQDPIDGRPPTVVNPAFRYVMAGELSKPLRALAEGKAYRLYRRDLPPNHPTRRVGDLGDALILTENDELVLE
jgi:hypothetical protein